MSSSLDPSATPGKRCGTAAYLAKYTATAKSANTSAE
jgi:hypothetical protein